MQVNQNYAKRFENRKQKQELARLREKHKGQDDSSEYSTEDEDGELLTPALDVEIFKTIDKIRNRKPEIYDTSSKFFSDAAAAAGDGDGGSVDGDEESDDDDDDDDEAGGAREKRRRPLTVKQQLLEQGATALVSDDEDDEDDDRRERRGANLAYDAEQRKLRQVRLV